MRHPASGEISGRGEGRQKRIAKMEKNRATLGTFSNPVHLGALTFDVEASTVSTTGGH
jgi:hypothetical protein